MENDDLSIVEKSVLLILMAEGGEIPNTVLTNKYRVTVSTESRTKLTGSGLAVSRMDAGRRYWVLTDTGWKRGAEELRSTEVPARAGASGAALYATLGVLIRYLDRLNVPYQDFYQLTDEAVVLPSGDAAMIEKRIRKAYGRIARQPGDWVTLAELRGTLQDLPRDQVDTVLVTMNRTPSVDIVPESNQKMLTKRDRDAAVIIGGRDKHVISIGL